MVESLMELSLWAEQHLSPLNPKNLMPKQPNPNYGKYAGIGFQLIAICCLFVLVGKWLDDYLKLNAAFLLVGIFISVFAVIYILIKKLK